MTQDIERELLKKETKLNIEVGIPTSLCVSAIAVAVPCLFEEILSTPTDNIIGCTRILYTIVLLALAFGISIRAIYCRGDIYNDISSLRRQLRDGEAKKV